MDKGKIKKCYGSVYFVIISIEGGWWKRADKPKRTTRNQKSQIWENEIGIMGIKEKA